MHIGARHETHRLYGARSGTLVLIRPDGYSLFCGEAATDTLFTYLDGVFSHQGQLVGSILGSSTDERSTEANVPVLSDPTGLAGPSIGAGRY